VRQEAYKRARVKPKGQAFPPLQQAQSCLIAQVKEHPTLCLLRMRNTITDTHTRNFDWRSRNLARL
jgi:hypothetical protein